MPEILAEYNPKEWKKQLHFERLKKEFESLLNGFESYQTDLVEFLKEDSINREKDYISSTFLVFDRRDWNIYKRNKNLGSLRLLGYITVMTDSIRLDNELKTKFRKEGIDYKSLPAMKIGRLCVDNEYLKRKIGKCMLAWAVARVVYLNQNIACRFITLDAKRHQDPNKDSFHFYSKFDFKQLKRNDKKSDKTKQKSGTTPMYLDLYQVIKAIKENQLKSG